MSEPVPPPKPAPDHDVDSTSFGAMYSTMAMVNGGEAGQGQASGVARSTDGALELDLRLPEELGRRVTVYYFYLWVRPVLPKPPPGAGDGRSQDVSWRQLIHPTVGAIPTPHGAWRKSDIPMVATGHQGCEAGCNGDNRRPRRPGRL